MMEGRRSRPLPLVVSGLLLTAALGHEGDVDLGPADAQAATFSSGTLVGVLACRLSTKEGIQPIQLTYLGGHRT